MRQTFIPAALCLMLAAGTAYATGPGGGSGGGASDGGGGGGGGSGGMSSACPFPMMPIIAGQIRGADFCLQNSSTPVLVKQVDPSWKDEQGLVPTFWVGTKGGLLSVE